MYVCIYTDSPVCVCVCVCVCVADRFTVQWDKVHVTNHEENGTFTFQVSLFPNGSIHFAYREVCMQKIPANSTVIEIEKVQKFL